MWQRLQRETMPDINLGMCWFTVGIFNPHEELKHITYSETLQKNVAIYGDSKASWWKPLAEGESIP